MFTFFTDVTTNASSYCVLNVNMYNQDRKKKKKKIFVDPGVYELAKSNEYSNIDFLHELARGKLLENEWISIDYPCDMNLQYEDEFIEKSVKNNLKYKDNPKYICTVQSKFQDFKDFKYQFDYLEEQIDLTKKIVGIGNLCRIMKPNSFTEKVFSFLIKKKKEHGYTYHFYGLSLKLIKKYMPYLHNCSVDSTKWTRAFNKTLKHTHGVCCKRSTRDLFFLEYVNEIKKYIKDVVY